MTAGLLRRRSARRARTTTPAPARPLSTRSSRGSPRAAGTCGSPGRCARQCAGDARPTRFADGIWTVIRLRRAAASCTAGRTPRSAAFPVLLRALRQHAADDPDGVRPAAALGSTKQIIAAAAVAVGAGGQVSPAVPCDRPRPHRLDSCTADAARCSANCVDPMTARRAHGRPRRAGRDRERLADLAVGAGPGPRRGRQPGRRDLRVLSPTSPPRSAASPRDDLVTALTTATVDGRAAQPRSEILDYCVILLPAGFETTASSMSFVLLLLAEHADRPGRAAPRPPSASPTPCEELMRLATPTRSHTRTRARRHRDRAADCCAPASASTSTGRAPTTTRGPSTVPGELDVDRRPNRHMAYGLRAAPVRGGCTWRAPSSRSPSRRSWRRSDDIAVEDPAAVVEEIGTTWALTHLPLTFTPRR